MISIVTTYTKTLKVVADTCTKKPSSGRKNDVKKEKYSSENCLLQSVKVTKLVDLSSSETRCAHECHPFVVINMNCKQLMQQS